MTTECCIVYMTAGSADEAGRIGEALIEERLAACVNIIDGMKSIYRWQGSIERASETVLIAKTEKGYVPALTERVKSMHSYDCPCVVALAVDDGNVDFLSWIGAQLR